MIVDIPEHALNPCDNFVGGWVGWLVKVDNTRRDVRLEVSLQWGASIWDWCEMSSANKNYTHYQRAVPLLILLCDLRQLNQKYSRLS